MATDFTQDSVLYFLQSNGGKVKNSELLFHYKKFIREHENCKQYREQFKKFVNSVAVVKQEEGVSYIVLRKTYLPHAGDIAAIHIPKTPGQKPEQAARIKERSPQTEVNRNQEVACHSLTETHLLSKFPRELRVPHINSNRNKTVKILPSAGILNNNNVDTVNFEKPVQSSSPNASWCAQPQVSKTKELCNTQSKRLCQGDDICKADNFKETVILPELNNKSLYTGAKLGKPTEPIAETKPFCPPPEYKHPHVVVGPPLQQVKQLAVPGQRRSHGVVDNSRFGSKAAPWPLHPLLEHAGRISTSSPCILDRLAAPQPHAPLDSELTRSNGSIAIHRPLQGLPDMYVQEEVESGAASLTSSQPVLSSLPLKEVHPPSAATAGNPDPHLHHISLQAPSQFSYVPSADSPERPRFSIVEEWASDEELDCRAPSGEQGFKVHDMLRRAQESSVTQRSERKVIPWHHSTGNILDGQSSAVSQWHHSTGHLDDQESSSSWHHSTGNLHDNQMGPGGSNPEMVPEPVIGPSVRRINSKLRSRLCRSLGADLDQPFVEDGISARQNRLHLLSSSLSFHYPFSGSSTPPRTHSYRDLAMSTTSSTKSLSTSQIHGSSYFHRQPLVPLDPKEHDWLVRGAAGTWTEIYSLFRDDPSLLTKRDFITGYTVLHWIAKHGDHRVLNTLWYGVEKTGLKLDIDSKTTCGYTPLHLAALHGHKAMIRLLVHKFKADISLRDTNGKKPWQYLEASTQGELLQLLGAPQRVGGATGGKTTTAPPPPSLVDRLAASPAHVKRSTSIAAFLKPKALLRNSESFF